MHGHDKHHLGRLLSASAIEFERLHLTSGIASLLGLSRISHKTSTGVSGLIAMPASIPVLCMYSIISFGLVLVSVWSSGFSAAVDVVAAS